VDDLFLVPQEVCGTEVDFVSDGLPYAVNKAVSDGRIEDLRFCVHSHVNMGTGFSGTDDNMVQKMGTTGTPWFVSAIFNKKGDTNGRVDFFERALPLPGVEQITVDADVTTWKAQSTRDEAKEELAQFVTKQKPASANPTKSVVVGGSSPGVGVTWRTPMKNIGAGSTKQDAPTTSTHDANWWEDDLEEELALYIQARRESWDQICDEEGQVYFFDAEGEYQGQATEMDEGTIDWFISRGWADDTIPLTSDDDIPGDLS